MKKTLFTAVALAAAMAQAYALDPGSFNLSSAKGTKPKVFLPDGTTVAAGANYLVDVVVLNPATSNFETVSGTTPLPSSLKTGANAGLFSAGAITVPFIAAGADATIKILVWDKTTGASFADASTAVGGIWGTSTFTTKLGGVVDAGTGIPGAPSDIIPAYTGITMTLNPPVSEVPEPSTYALMALGLGSLLFFRRK
jgi:hypothetical protein